MHTLSKLWAITNLSLNTTHVHAMNRADEKKIPPTHPGTLLKEEFMDPLDISQSALARGLGVDKRRVHEIVHGRRSVTADTAARLATFFETSVGFWLNLQARYETDMAEDHLERVREEVTPYHVE